MADSGSGGTSAWRVGDVVDGRYEVLEELGRGGMGVVHRVRHREWGMDLAVKSPRAELFRDEDDKELFSTEAEVWVSLGLHPNVCGCHYVRTLGGVPRVFAEYVAGGSLAQWIADRRLYAGGAAAALGRILGLAIETAWGLEHAHTLDDGGLVHQDVKPANVLLDVSADGMLTAKVTDFGLAKARAVAAAAATQPDATGASSLVSVGGLTPAYASPEQIDGVGVGRGSDIYSFAASVLEMFTGGVTWATGPVAGAALAAHVGGSRDPDLPEMPPGLVTLLDSCLRHERGERPSSMAAVAEDLTVIYRQAVGEAYPRARPVAAELRADELNNRGLSLLDLGRRAEAAEAFDAAIAANPGHLEATYNDGLRLWRSGTLADDALLGRLQGARTASGDSWAARYLLAEVHLERGDLAAAGELLGTVEQMASQQPKIADALRTVRAELSKESGRASTRAISWHEYEGPGIPVMDIRFTADGQRALAVSGKHVGLWDVRGGECLVRLSSPLARTRIDVSANGRFALCGGEARVGLWDLTTTRALWQANVGRHVYTSIQAVSLSADARVAAVVLSTVAASRDDANVLIYDARTGRLLRRIGEHAGHVRVELSTDGRFLLTSGRGDGDPARLWDVDTGTCVRVLHRDERGVSAMAMSSDVKTAAVGRNEIGLWDLATGRRIRTLIGHTRPIRSLSWSSDGHLLLSSADDDTVRLWEVHSGRCLRTFPLVRSGPWSQATVLLAPESGSPIVAEVDAVHRWPLPDRHTAPPQLSRPRRHAELTRLDADAAALIDTAEHAIADREYAEAHRLLIRARSVPGHERSPRAMSAWRSLAGALPRVGVRASWQVREFESRYQGAVDLSADGSRAACSVLYALQVWDAETGSRLREIQHPSMVTAARLSPDQRSVSSASFCGQLGVWSVETGECLMKITNRQNAKAYVTQFSADGRRAVCNAHDSIRLWDLTSGRRVRTFTSRDGFGTVALSADGSRAAATTGADRETVRVWDVATGECLHTLIGHTSRIGGLALSPNGEFAASGDDQKTMRLWDLTSGACIQLLPELPGRLWSVRFFGDDRFLMTGYSNGALQIWDPYAGRCLHTISAGRGEVRIAPAPDGRFALSHGGGAPLRLWEFDWEYAVNAA